jgi:hypothetical protein
MNTRRIAGPPSVDASVQDERRARAHNVRLHVIVDRRSSIVDRPSSIVHRRSSIVSFIVHRRRGFRAGNVMMDAQADDGRWTMF